MPGSQPPSRQVTSPADAGQRQGGLAAVHGRPRCPASIWRANTRSGSTSGPARIGAARDGDLAAAAIYLVRLGHGIGLGGTASTWMSTAPAPGCAARRRSVRPAAQARRRPRAIVHLPSVRSPELHPTCIGYITANWLLTAATIVCVAASLRCFAADAGASGRRPDAAALARALPGAAARTRPLHLDLRADQRAIMALVVQLPDPGVPMAARGPCRRRPALKLAPGVFLLFFLLRRDLRSAARAGLSFAACTGAGFALAPHDSLVLDPDRLPARADRRMPTPRTSPSSEAWTGSASAMPHGPGSGSA